MTHQNVPEASAAESITWRKATASDANSGCVEIASLADGQVGIRDSKNPGAPALVVSADAWAGLLMAVKAGLLDL
jgi:hypothetical protein